MLIIVGNGSTLASPESLRPSVTKPNSDGMLDTKKPTPVSIYLFKNSLKIKLVVEKKYASEWEIRPEDLLSHGRMVGRGTYGTVYKAEVRLHGKRIKDDYDLFRIHD